MVRVMSSGPGTATSTRLPQSLQVQESVMPFTVTVACRSRCCWSRSTSIGTRPTFLS